MSKVIIKENVCENEGKTTLKEFEIRKFAGKFIKAILHFFGYCVITPLSYIIPKANYVVLISRFGDLDGNLKYLYMYLTGLEENAEFVFLTGKKEVFNTLKEKQIKVWFYPSASTMLRLLRTRLIIVDGNEWVKQLKYYFLAGSKKTQVWHGTGIKTIGLLKPKIKSLNKLQKMVRKENTYYDLVVLSSDYQVEKRSGAFRYGRLQVNGLPRNDIFFNPELIKCSNLNCDHRLLDEAVKYKEKGYQVIAYVPTWRKYNYTFKHLSLKDINDFASHNSLIFVIKLHPKHKCLLDLSDYRHVFEYDQYSDIYPLLTYTDLLITDYSSIYLDFLLTGRPIVFYPYDGEEYIGEERELLLDYKQVTPGPVCYSQEELEQQISAFLVQGRDAFASDREAIRKLFFKYQDGNSSQRLWKAIKSNNLAP